jgi:hypothetical protein
MKSLTRDELPGVDYDPDRYPQKGWNIVKLRRRNHDRDSLSENFTNELDAWARQALAANGFGDY